MSTKNGTWGALKEYIDTRVEDDQEILFIDIWHPTPPMELDIYVDDMGVQIQNEEM